MRQRRFVLLDRDGTLNIERHYLSNPDDVELLPNTLSGLQRLHRLGLGLAVATNQSTVRSGVFDLARLGAIHKRLESLLKQGGIILDGIYVCPHIPEDACNCRKPQPGLALRAAEELQFDPAQAFVIGDKVIDIELGQRIGAITLLVQTGYGPQEAENSKVWPDFIVADLVEAAKVIETIVIDPAREVTVRSGEDTGLRIRRHLLGSIATKQRILEQCQADILGAAGMIASCLQKKRKLLLCGNGGSAADCQHIAGEFVNVLSIRFPRHALPAIALTTDASVLTSTANDFGFERVFERQVEALGQPGDVLLGISTSGNSENVVRAVQCARERGLHTLALTGDKSSELVDLAQISICVPSNNVQHIQEAHITIGHIICDLVEQSLFTSKKGSE